MARVRTVDFLPEIFQTSTNKQFLAATLDQLVQEPSVKRIQGFVGRQVGPGVNPNDEYVKEDTAERTNYQLEPGVILKQRNQNAVRDAITYPGITDAIGLAGGFTDNADRLYTSEYYTWDPFVDFDKLVNFSQYYWLPGGPDAVDVFAGQLPLTDTFTVTRDNGVYTFSGVAGENPVINLVRGGSYQFQVAQNAKETVNYRVTNDSTSAFVIDYQPNPTLTLVRGNTYVFDLSLKDPYAFYIKTLPTLGTTNQFTQGVTNNGAISGQITFVVPTDAPDTLYYANDLIANLKGTFNIIDGTPGTGPGFWIQVDPGVDGKLIATPNISGRDVLGVVNNGEDLGTVTFNVPLATAQNFYYTLNSIDSQLPTNGVDLICNLNFDQLNNVFVDRFLVEHPNGIDGITNLDGKTLVFINQNPDAESGGWQDQSQFDPLLQGTSNNGKLGSYDTTLFDQTTVIPESVRYDVWQVNYVTTDAGNPYIRLTNIFSVSNYDKFDILSGTTYSSTQWYKNANGYFEQIPLLTAAKSVLYYQDGTDPEIFGQIRLFDQDNSDVIDINDILGKPNYTSPNGVVFTNGLKVTFIGTVVPSSYQNNSYYVEGVGTGIKLLPVQNYVTPETYTQSATIPYDSTGYDIGNYDASLNQPLVPDYLTINRAAPDLNAWARSNRWFHIDVINASAVYNNTVAVVDNNFRAKRPILEYRAGTRLYNFGTQSKQPVDVIDFNATDALSTINGSIGYGIDGYTLINGSRVIFAADVDPQVRNKIYEVQFIVPDTVAPLIPEPIINLVPADDATVLPAQTVVCLSGNTQQGISFYFDGVDWRPGQQKTSVNQPPLFDVYDTAGVSFGDLAKYPSTNFAGSKLFSYAVGSGTVDPVLQFPLRYLSLRNVGDIVFDNNLYTDTFTYTRDSVSSTVPISTGYVREYSNRTDFIKEIGWQTAAAKSVIRQQFRFNYDGSPLILDVPVTTNSKFPALQLYVASKFIDPSNYSFQIQGDRTIITLQAGSGLYSVGDVIEVEALSSVVSNVAFYQVPDNLENNPLNANSEYFTLGTVRSHYETIGENLKNIVGPINGANNTRDLGNIIPYGTNILQQSSPMTLAGYFMRSREFNVFNSLEYNSREYEKFKAQLLDTAVRNDYTNYTIPDMLTAIINDINIGKTENNSFYWSDMLPASSIYTQSTTTITPISTNVFDLSTTYDFTSSNYKALLVYVNDRLLTIDADYTVAVDGPRLTITSPLQVGDVVIIREYGTTYGNFVPNTPTKMGLYPAYRPSIYVDPNYVNPQVVIQGHDGSITMAFNDFRDELLLEFETRIFNNLKIKSEIPLQATEVVPGQFRTTDYTLNEINQILSRDFLSWIGWNKLNYQFQDYIANNEFTWNYSATGNKLTGPNEKPMPVGAWRGLYDWFYDTASPNTTPWEMLGFSIKPGWWNEVYGDGPYTADNLVLWDDLAEGKVADPSGVYYRPEYARPRLTEIIPTNTSGQLLSPFDSVVGFYDSSQFKKSWVFGDSGPVEYSWRKSSSYPFAVMRLLALTRPAEFFSLFADRDLYKFDTDYDQYLYNGRYRLDANGVEVYGNGVSKASYINWIVDYNQQTGFNSTTALEQDLASLDVRLCYRMAAFTDKQYLKIYTEKSSPNSLNSSLLLPDESYNLLVYKNQPFEQIVYSSVIFQVVEGGYAVYGYSITNPYFEILTSKTSGTTRTISAGGSTVRVPNQYTDQVVRVPYGYVFTNKTVVVDFLLSYGQLLTQKGLVFTDKFNGSILNWPQMAQEFLYWANQGWEPGSVINLNPAAFSLTVVSPEGIIDTVVAQTPENNILDQNRTTIPVRDLVVDRLDNTFKVTSLNQQTISYLELRFTSFENMVVLDNTSIFNDLIYDPTTGARQNRVSISATVSADWNGQVDAQGFVLNDDRTVREWEPNIKYAKGEIVLYKNNYWSAQNIVQPRAEFDYADWVKSDYTKIQRGLLQNLPTLSNQLQNSYSVDSANLETDQDLVAYGLIGFRPREYMASLNLSDVSQVNVYQQFLKDKGTIRSVRLFGNAKTDKETAEYDLYENWAVLRGTYGANANRSFIEVRLNEADLQADPATVQIINPDQSSLADQTVLLQDLWRQSYKIPSTDILPTTSGQVQDVALPTAGYVNLDDVDVTVFSLDGNLGLAPGVIDTIGIGTTVWAAKINSYDWGVFRCTRVPGFVSRVSNNLNSTSVVQFSGKHGLSVNDVAVIRFFDSAVDGVYRVLAVPSANTIIIELSLNKTVSGKGISVVLRTMRVAQASDIINLSYANDLTSGNKAWVDNDGTGRWVVLEKQPPFAVKTDLNVDTSEENSLFGSSIAQGENNTIAMVGSPGYVPAPSVDAEGAVYTYVRDTANQYTNSSILTLGTTGVRGYGNSVDIGNLVWGIAGASASNSNMGYATVINRPENSGDFEQRQLLVPPDLDFGGAQFGYSVSVSKDERWMFVGAPGVNKVYAFARRDWESQSVKYTTNGTSNIFSFADNIVIDSTEPEQISVVYNNKQLTYATDYVITGSNVVLNTIPPQGQTLLIFRKEIQQIDNKTYYSIEQDLTSGIGSGAQFTVTNTRGTYSVSLVSAGTDYQPGDTITILGANIGTDNSGPTPPGAPNNLTITVTAVDDNNGIESFTFSGSGVGNNYIFPLSPYLYNAVDIWSISVTVDGVLQRPYVDYDFNSDSALYNLDLVFNTVPAAGATITVSAKTQFVYVDTLTVPGLALNAGFGSSVTETADARGIIVGAIRDDSATVSTSGAAYVFDRGVIEYIVEDTADKTFTLPNNFIEPVSVILNGQYLQNSAQFINGQFSVVGNSVVLSADLELNVGDVVEIENNIFTKIQKLTAATPFDQAQYGYAMDVCPTNCSLYIGSPTDGSILIQAGSTERRVNQSRLYGVITSKNSNPALTAGDTIRINNQEVAVPSAPNNTIAGLSTAINTSGIPNVTSSVAGGLLTISVINSEAATEFDKLQVLPGFVGTAFNDIGFDTFAFAQTIVSPNATEYARFGSAVTVSSDATTLVVGAPNGNVYEPNTFDNETTFFDDKSTTFSNNVFNSGVVYSYDFLPSAQSSVTNPGKFVFGQQIYNTGVATLDLWGSALSYKSGRLLVGSPGSDLGDSAANYGRVSVFENPNNKPTWVPIHIQAPVADVNLINSVFMYDKLQSSKTYFFDFINPLQGKILGVARQNIDFIGSDDPAKYNVGNLNNNGNFWGEEHLGQIWWDISSVRFIDPNQNDIVYASRRWAQLFPGSRVEVFQWIESDVPPANYTGPGQPLNNQNYTVTSRLNQQGIFTTQYYFWVSGLDTINTAAGKTLSTVGIARYIESPRSSGIPYIAPLTADSFAIYNGLEFISAADTIIHIEYDREYTEDNIHTEYELIAQDDPNSFISAGLYRKLQDSFCGVNNVGAPVPDITLSPAERYGVQFRPRQSMFLDRFGALQNYLEYANSVMAKYPISESRSFTLLNSSEPEPTAASGEWNKKVANLAELSYQDLYEVPLGYKYLVTTDSNYNGLWSIYTVTQTNNILGNLERTTLLTRVQNYDTRQYWNYINWYDPGYNSSVVPVNEVPNYSALASIALTTPVGASVKVTANAQGKFEIYLRTLDGWNRVGLEDGTIEFKQELWDYAIGRFGFDVEVFDAQFFDEEPVIETRFIIRAINEELFIGELAVERNRALILMFNYILTEFQAPEWLTKTSLIDVNHKIRRLLPFQVFRQDNQDFVLDYIQEVKPYHVQIREFQLTYDGSDEYAGQMTDFDNPSYYDRLLEIPQYISPILLPYDQSTAVGTGTASSISDAASDAEIWTKRPWLDWYNNYLLSISEVEIINGGSGYTSPPEVTVSGDAVVLAEMTAVINSAGQVVAINVINPGQGYRTTPVITITGGNGTGAKAYAVMGNGLVRSIKTTIKYDRYQYNSTIVEWQPNVNYPQGTQVRYNNRVWSADATVQSAEFDIADWTQVPAGDLNGVDRTMGYYTSTPNEPGLQLPLLVDGVEYPGVQVKGVEFNQNTGFDVGNYDINVFDNISYGPGGFPTYDPGILDAIYESEYLDIYLGTRPTDINVDGGAYIDTYSSFAPEELVPGSEFDTLDMRVYTRPGSDWAQNGHGFQTYSGAVVTDTVPQTFSFDSWYQQVADLVSLSLVNVSTGVALYENVDYTVNWPAQTFTLINGYSVGDSVEVTAFGVGGGNQLFKQVYAGNDIGDSVTVPVQYSLIQEVDVWVNGSKYTGVTFTAGTNNTTVIDFATTFTSNDVVTIYVLGPTTIDSTTVNYSWSSPTTQYIIADGSTTLFDLDNSMAYTNPANMIVTVNGVRARTASGVEYYADGSSGYELPTRLGFSQALIADNEVSVYINDIPQTLGVDFTVDPFTGGNRQVSFAVPPATGERILIAVTTNTQARITGGSQLFIDTTQGLIPVAGDVIAVTTWNDTRQQDILTTVYVGPVSSGAIAAEGYDSTNFDTGTVNDAPGSFDYSAGIIVTNNDLFLGRTIVDPSRLVVTLNGFRLFYGDDYTIVNDEIILASGLLTATDVVMITQFTDSVVPNAMAFRIFQDMRGLQATYRITPNATTVLTQTLELGDDIIYVENAGALDQPNVEANIWGVLTIGGERIMYRERDIVNNTVSSLRRGTAGTAVDEHAVGSTVYAMGRGQIMPAEFQNYVVSNSFLGDGSTTTFYATNISFDDTDSTLLVEAVEVYVGGTRILDGYDVVGSSPVSVDFDTAPPEGVGITILVRRGVNWYEPGVNTPSNGVALQDTNTQAARFLRGL